MVQVDPIRAVLREDLPALKELVDATGLFPSGLLDEMLAGYLAGERPAERWLTSDPGDRAVAVAHCAPERMAEGTSTLLLIAVHPDYQGRGGRPGTAGPIVERELGEPVTTRNWNTAERIVRTHS